MERSKVTMGLAAGVMANSLVGMALAFMGSGIAENAEQSHILACEKQYEVGNPAYADRVNDAGNSSTEFAVRVISFTSAATFAGGSALWVSKLPLACDAAAKKTRLRQTRKRSSAFHSFDYSHVGSLPPKKSSEFRLFLHCTLNDASRFNLQFGSILS